MSQKKVNPVNGLDYSYRQPVQSHLWLKSKWIHTLAHEWIFWHLFHNFQLIIDNECLLLLSTANDEGSLLGWWSLSKTASNDHRTAEPGTAFFVLSQGNSRWVQWTIRHSGLQRCIGPCFWYLLSFWYYIEETPLQTFHQEIYHGQRSPFLSHPLLTPHILPMLGNRWTKPFVPA